MNPDKLPNFPTSVPTKHTDFPAVRSALYRQTGLPGIERTDTTNWLLTIYAPSTCFVT